MRWISTWCMNDILNAKRPLLLVIEYSSRTMHITRVFKLQWEYGNSILQCCDPLKAKFLAIKYTFVSPYVNNIL